MNMRLRTAMMVVAAISLIFFSCKKEYEERSCDTPSKVECKSDSGRVNVRVINFTGYPLCDFQIKYQNNQAEYEYGTLDVDEATCYTIVDYAQIYPQVFFNLGNGEFMIKDTLLSDKYKNLEMKSNGFYSYFIQTAHSLDSQLVVTTFVVEDL